MQSLATLTHAQTDTPSELRELFEIAPWVIRDECETLRAENALKPKELIALRLICRAILTRCYGATAAEIAKAADYGSERGAQRVIERLEDKGWIIREGIKSRIVGAVDPDTGRRFGRLRDSV